MPRKALANALAALRFAPGATAGCGLHRQHRRGLHPPERGHSCAGTHSGVVADDARDWNFRLCTRHTCRRHRCDGTRARLTIRVATNSISPIMVVASEVTS